MPVLSRAAFGTGYGAPPYAPPSTAITSIPGSTDAYVVRYDLNGGAIWAARIGGSGADGGYEVTNDVSGNVYVTGTHPSAITAYNADGSIGALIPSGGGSGDVFLAKYTPLGSVLWGARIGSPSADTLPAITIDTVGNILLVGQFGSGSTVTAYNADGTAFATTISASGSDAVLVKYSPNGVVQWIAKTGSGANDIGYSVATDSLDAVYISGKGGAASVVTAYNASGTAFATTIPNGGAEDAFVVKYDSSGNVQWITRIASSGSDAAFSVAVDRTGSALYVAGNGGGSLTTTAYNSDGTAFATTIPSAGNTDAILVKYNLSGFVQWVTRIASTGADIGAVVRVDASGNVYMTGTYTGTATAYNSDGTTFSTTIGNSGGEVFVVKYNSAGFVQWWARIGSPAADSTGGIAIDSSGNVYASFQGGSTTGAITVYNAAGSSFGTLANVGLADTCIIKYNSVGAVQWARRLASTGSDGIRGVSIGSNNDLYAIGSFGGSQLSVYSASTLVSTIPNAGLIDGFVVKYNQNGAPQWTARIGSTADDSALGTSTDSSGNVYVTGATGAGVTTTFYNADGSAFATTLTSTGTDAYLAKYSTDGAVLWVAAISSTGTDVGYAVSTDSSGNVYVTGAGGTATVTAKNADGTSFSPSLTSSAGDAFVVKYNSSGFVQWNTRIASTSDDAGFAIKTDLNGDVYVTGQTGVSVTTTVYNADGNTFQTLSTLTDRDTFLVKYNTSGVGQWCARIGGTGADVGYGLAIDSSNNVYIVGSGGSANVSAYNSGGGSAFGTVANAGAGDAFIVKYNSSGTGQWITRIASTLQDTAYSISTDGLNNLYLAVKAGTITLYNADGTAYTNTITASGQDGFVVKYNSAGFVQWGCSFGGSGNTDTAFSIQADSDGNTYVAGAYGTGTNTVTVYNSDNTLFTQSYVVSAVLVKFNTSGFGIWTQFLRGTTTSATGRGLSIDKFNNVYLSGNTVSAQPLNVFYNDYTPYLTLVTTGTQDAFVAKYSPSLKPQWIARITSTGTTDLGYSVLSDSSGNVYAVGTYTAGSGGAVTIWNANSSSFGSLTNAGSGSIFVVKYDKDGAVLWATRIDGLGADTSLQAAMDSSNNLYVSGYSGGGSGNITPYNSDGSAFTGIVPGGGLNNDAYIVKYNSAGVVQWTAKMFASGNSDDLINGIATDTSGNVYVTGSYTTATFTAYSSNGVAFGTTLANAGGQDIFVVKYDSAGTVQWLARVASTSTSEQGNGIAADASGNVYIAAQYIGTVTAYNSDGLASALPTLSSAGSSDGLLVKYNSSGTAQWMARVVSSTLADTATSVAVDSGGSVYVAGAFVSSASVCNAGNGTSVFGTLVDIGGAGNTSINTYLVKYNSSGTAQWATKAIDGTGNSGSYFFVKVDSSGNVYVVGGSAADNIVCYSADGTAFGSGWFNSATPGVLIKYNSSGVGQALGLLYPSASIRGVEIDSGNNVYIAGMFNASSLIIGST